MKLAVQHTLCLYVPLSGLIFAWINFRKRRPRRVSRGLISRVVTFKRFRVDLFSRVQEI